LPPKSFRENPQYKKLVTKGTKMPNNAGLWKFWKIQKFVAVGLTGMNLHLDEAGPEVHGLDVECSTNNMNLYLDKVGP
jgi:hypothetical protein